MKLEIELRVECVHKRGPYIELLLTNMDLPADVPKRLDLHSPEGVAEHIGKTIIKTLPGRRHPTSVLIVDKEQFVKLGRPNIDDIIKAAFLFEEPIS